MPGIRNDPRLPCSLDNSFSLSHSFCSLPPLSSFPTTVSLYLFHFAFTHTFSCLIRVLPTLPPPVEPNSSSKPPDGISGNTVRKSRSLCTLAAIFPGQNEVRVKPRGKDRRTCWERTQYVVDGRARATREYVSVKVSLAHAKGATSGGCPIGPPRLKSAKYFPRRRGDWPSRLIYFDTFDAPPPPRGEAETNRTLVCMIGAPCRESRERIILGNRKSLSFE